MKRYRYLLIGVSACLIATFLAGAYFYKKSERERTEALAKKHAETLVRAYSPTLGSADAKVTIVEFLDPECEACRAFFPIVKRVVGEFEGKARLVVRHVPFHPNSSYAIRLLEGARTQGKYWEALEMMFERQPEWASHHNPKSELLMGYMRKIGLDTERLKSSIEDAEVGSKLRQDEEDSAMLGVMSTPTFFVNGKQLERLGYEELKREVENGLSLR